MIKADTLYQLGLDYYHGHDLPKDTDMAIDYFLKASQLNHVESKIFGADLLFKQAKNDRSIYYEDGYRLGTELMVDVYRLGQLEPTLPYLLNNKLFNEMCTTEELQDYYQEAYRLGYRDTKFELAKLLFANEAYQSAEQWFLESIEEDISKESHLYLYHIYRSKACYDEKKSLYHLKEALKYGFIPQDYQEFINSNQGVLVENTIYDSQFSEDKIKAQVASVIKNCYYADQSFKEWFSEQKILVHVHFELKTRLLNASYDLLPSENQVDFMYEPVELKDNYFSEETNNDLESEVVTLSNKDSGFYQSKERDSYLEIQLDDLFNRFNIRNMTPHLNTLNKDDGLDQMIQSKIRKDIKNKHKEKSKSQMIRVKKFDTYKILIPSFDFEFIYQGKEYISQKYAFDDKDWMAVFQQEIEEMNFKAIKLNLEFPLGDAVYQEIEQIKEEVPRYQRLVKIIHLAKSLVTILLLWSLIIFIQNTFFMKDNEISSYNFLTHLSDNLIWYVGGVIFFSLLYTLTRIRIYAPIINNIRDKIIENPAYVLPENTNRNHFKMQYLEILLKLLFFIIFLLFSNFLNLF